MKPIEPGCLALIKSVHNPEFKHMIGHAVVVIDRYDVGGRHCRVCNGSIYWNIGEYASCECSLMRIDPDEDFKEEECQLKETKETISSVS